MSTLYLVRDGDRNIALAAEHAGKLHCYVPNVDAFVYNKPLSVDFLIDRNKQYDPLQEPAAAQIIHEARIGRIDHTNKTLMKWATSEPRRLNPDEVLSAEVDPDWCTQTAPAGGYEEGDARARRSVAGMNPDA